MAHVLLFQGYRQTSDDGDDDDDDDDNDITIYSFEAYSERICEVWWYFQNYWFVLPLNI